MSLIGTWELVSCEHFLDGGAVERPLGESPLGRLVYTADGYMIVMLMRRDRARFASNQLFEAAGAELAAAGRDFIAYSGPYELDGSTAIHRVDMSYYPNWIGTAQIRAYALENGSLSFETRHFEVRGVRQKARLVWRPAPSPRTERPSARTKGRTR
jgi:hypothetical protein